MRFTINKTELQIALNTVLKGVSTRSTLPVLSGIMLDARGDEVILQSTDLEYSVQYTVAALVDEPGRTVVPGKLLSDIVKNLADAAVTVQAAEGEAHITCDTSSFSVRTLNAEDFPGFPHVETDQTIEIPFPAFADMVKRVARVVSRDESRAILTGILITLEEGVLRMVATDSYRLAVCETALPEAIAEDFEAVILGSFMNEIASLPKTEDMVRLAIAENQIVATCGPVVFINRRIEGNYPNYKQLLPDTYASRAELEVSALAASVKRASLLSSSTAPMRFDLNAASQTTQITVSSPDVGTAQETLPCAIEGEDVQIAFNSLYVMDGLAAISGEKVSLEVQSDMKPGILRAAEPENYLYLIMPVRL
ncbi:DNA polymerase III subunit beta [Adlercreutzia murintestinalis]|jgi:DNA polymerase III, beta subunit|uniref:DNA polymerase III subunit beta n=1 Tax=Adlercreutzia murintestinalis TaxID=2941325 RepID=UPI00203F1253|nr:DNA polymerase III subunit beta [Adlercreutzia murintestinalis]